MVVNEAYAEIINDPADPFTGMVATMNYKVNFWIELLNPLMNGTILDPTSTKTNTAILQNANVLRAFCATANAIQLSGYVNAITA